MVPIIHKGAGRAPSFPSRLGCLRGRNVAQHRRVTLALLHPQGVMESFLGTAMAGSMFCLFAGQPLIILSSTGPILIFEKLLFDFSK